MKAPATLDEFYRSFPTERRCWEALRRMRWPNGFRCPRCEGRKAHRLRSRGLWQCAACRYPASLRPWVHHYDHQRPHRAIGKIPPVARPRASRQ